jgi:predicted GIY-YIG superfamily endonuclease
VNFSRLNKEEKPLGYVYIPYVKGFSEKFKRVGNRYNVRTIFRMKDTLRNSLIKTRPNTDPQRTAKCVYSIPCECGRSYTGETGRPLAVRLREHKHNFKEGLIEKSKLAQHAYEEDHKVIWDEARVLEVESNSRYRKYKESAHIISLLALLANPVWILLPFVSPLSVMR